MKKNKKDIQGIECMTVEGDQAEVAVIFFHGYGANMNDLLPLWELWHQEKFSWFFPNGIQSLPMGYYEGRAWFPIDVEALERSMRTGTPRDMANSIPVHFDETIKHLELFLTDIKTKFKKIIIGGFSQGAMCASHLATRLPVDGLILLSGSLVAQERIPKVAKSAPFYQSHGSRDPVLDLAGAKQLEEKLLSLNFQGKLHVFDGGHEIPSKVIHEVKQFIIQFA